MPVNGDVLIGEPMVTDEIISLLKSKGHGVLSMGVDDHGYGIPMSYGYDEEQNRVVMEFVTSTGTKKGTFVEETEEATLTVYNYADKDTWESVIVTGTIHPIDEEDVYDRYAALFFSQADDAAGQLRWTESIGGDRQWYELRPTELTGRHSGKLPHHHGKNSIK